MHRKKAGAEQTGFDFHGSPSHARSDFILGGCNAMAADRIDRWPDWPGRIRGLVIAGPEASGKSHLGAIWQEASGAQFLSRLDAAAVEEIAGQEAGAHVLLDHPVPDSGDWPEDVFFHLLNSIAQAGGSVLILTRELPARQGWQMDDLASRLRGMTAVEIGHPDDALLAAIMQKIADDRGLVLSDEVMRYITSRMERSFAAAGKIIAAIDRLALARKARPGHALVQEVLDSMAPELPLDTPPE